MFDFKNERFIVNGSHDASKLQQLLDGFIKRFVLCPECSNPETQLVSLFQMMIVSFLLVSFKVQVQGSHMIDMIHIMHINLTQGWRGDELKNHLCFISY